MSLNINSEKIINPIKMPIQNINEAKNNVMMGPLQQTSSSSSSSSPEIIATQRNLETNFLSSIQRYELEWQDLSTIAGDQELKRLRQVSIDGLLKVSKFRSVCWALLLNVFRGNSKIWVAQRLADREKYRILKTQFNANPHEMKIANTEDNPLSQSDQSIWNQHFCDKELCAVIKQDVIRTFPGVEFFRRPIVQDIMTNILFCYAREHPEICYRQGMHEILAPVLFVLHSDHQALLHIKEMTKPDEDMATVLDSKYLEEDAYFMFSKIMSAIESYYRIHDMIPSSTGYFPVSPPISPDDRSKSKLEVVGQLNFIRDKILAKEDLHLHNHLLKLDIPLPIFGIRWLRLLFGREFPLQDLLILWDAIFAEGDHFELNNFIVVAMLVRIRSKLLSNDYTGCLTYLMKYPGNIDITMIIRHALHMKSPQKYERPPGVFVYVTNTKSSQNSDTKTSTSIPINRATTLPRNVSASSNSTKVSSSVGRKHTNSHDETKAPLVVDTSSVQKAHEEKIAVNVNTIQTSTAIATMRIAAKSNGNHADQDKGILDGYIEDGPEMLKIQLQNCHTTMAISRLKLGQYLAVLKKHFSPGSADDVSQALDGIEEICALLKTKFDTPYSIPAPVDRAFEANEISSQKTIPPSSLPLPPNNVPSNATVKPRRRYSSEHSAKSDFVRQICNEPNFEILTMPSDDNDSDNIIKPTSLATLSSSDSDSYTIASAACETTKITSSTTGLLPIRRSRYEMPENQLTRVAAKIIGDRKELEMHEFMSSNMYGQYFDDDYYYDQDYVVVPNIDPSGDRRDSPNDSTYVQ